MDLGTLQETLRVFHGGGVDAAMRKELESRLNWFAENAQGVEIAAVVIRGEVGQNDPQLLMFCAILLENAARKRFAQMNTSFRQEVVKSVLSALASGKYPEFLDGKLCNLVVQFGKRELILPEGSRLDFLNTVLSMIQSNDSAARRSGSAILSVAVEDCLDPLKTDLLSMHRNMYKQMFISRTEEISLALISGLSAHDERIACMSVEGIMAMIKIVRSNDTMIQALQDISARRRGDECAIVAINGLTEVYGLRGLTSQNLLRALDHLLSLLTSRHSASDKLDIAVLSMAEILLEKNIMRLAADPEISPRLGSSLAALLDFTTNTDRNESFISALKCWFVVAERLVEAMSESNQGVVAAATAASERLREGLMALAQGCLQKALFAYNSNVLEKLEYWSDEELDTTSDKNLLRDVAVDPQGETEAVISDRSNYIAKCLEVINELTRLYTTSVRPAALSFALDALRDPSRDIRDKKVVLQLLTDSASGESDENLASVIESIAAQCLNGPPQLRLAAYRSMRSLAGALDRNHVLAMSIASCAATDSVLSDDSAKSVTIAAAEFLKALTSKVRSPIFREEPVGGTSVARVKCPKTASLLTATAMTLWLMPPDGNVSIGGKISPEEWRERGNRFRKFLLESLAEYGLICANVQSVTLSAELSSVVMRSVAVLDELMVDVRGELSATRDAVWYSCEEMISSSAKLLGKVGLYQDGVLAVALLRMLSKAFAAFRRFLGALPMEVIQVAFALSREPASKTTKDRVNGAFLTMLHAELREIAPGSGENLLPSIIDMCLSILRADEDPDLKILTMSTLKEALGRHWRFFFPGDTSVGMVSGKDNNTPSESLHFTKVMECIHMALASPEPAVCASALDCLAETEKSRRLFSRPTFKSTDIGLSTFTALFNILFSRTQTTLYDSLSDLLYKIASAANESFFEVFLLGLLRSQAYLTDDMRKFLLDSFGSPTDRPSFVASMDCLSNDVAYFSLMKSEAKF